MGGVASGVGAAVQKGVVSPIKSGLGALQDVGLAPKPDRAGQLIQEAAAKQSARPGVDVPAQGRDEAAEALAARRRARRGGRALLSEARLNPESGVQTLGSSGML